MAAAAKGADLIVNGLNPPAYHDWDRLIPEITASVLAAGKASGATLLVPGNVYPYGTEPGPWNADTPHRPTSRKGRIRAEMEAQYREASSHGQRTILLRGGDFLLPQAPQMLMNRVILGKVAKGIVTTLGDPDALHAYAYLPDMARAAVGLVSLGRGTARLRRHPLRGPCLYNFRPCRPDFPPVRPPDAHKTLPDLALHRDCSVLGTGARVARDAVSLQLPAPAGPRARCAAGFPTGRTRPWTR